MAEATKRRRTFDLVLLVLILLVSYVYFFPRWADPNQNSRLDMIVAVVDDGTFQIDRYVANTVDYARVGEHYYSDKPPGSAFLGIPVYAGLRLVFNTPLADRLVEKLSNNAAFQSTLKADGSGVYADKVRFAIAQVALTWIIPVLATVITAVLLYLLLGKLGLSPAIGWLAAISFGLLTPVFAYAGAYYSHMISACFLLAAFFLARGQAFQRPWRLLLAGFLMGFAVLSEYSVLLIAAILFFYAGWRLWKQGMLPRLGYVVATAAVCGAALMVYNQTVYGGPFRLGYEYSELWQPQHQTGFLSLTMPHMDAIWGITFSPFRGLFFFSPLLLLAVPGFVVWWRTRVYRAEWWVSLAVVLSMFLFNTSSVMWWGGFAVGPRYFLPALPFLALGLGFGLQLVARHRSGRALGLALAAWSAVATWGLAIAGQAFPSDQIANPLMEYALPNWQSGNVARNLGTILGLKGITGLLPLALFLILAVIVWGVGQKRFAPAPADAAPAWMDK
jgi:hypothetical protein